MTVASLEPPLDTQHKAGDLASAAPEALAMGHPLIRMLTMGIGGLNGGSCRRLVLDVLAQLRQDRGEQHDMRVGQR